MVYITVKQPVMYRQMTLEELLFSDTNMEECNGCKFDVLTNPPKNNEEFCLSLDKCSLCRRAYHPAYANGYEDLYERIKE